MRTFILCNVLDSVNAFVYQNHIAFHTYNAKKFKDDTFYIYTPHRQSIDRSRNEAAQQALQLECDYLMFIDDDVLVPQNAFEILKNANKDIIEGLVYLRGYPFNVMAFKQLPDIEKGKLALGYYNDWEENKDEDGLVKLMAVGFSCCLINMDVVRALEPPYFITGTHNTEDVYFCLRTRELDPQPGIYLHPEVKCGHFLNPEPIEYETKDLQIAYCEGLVEKFNKLKPGEAEEQAQARLNPRTKEYVRRNIMKF